MHVGSPALGGRVDYESNRASNDAHEIALGR